MKLVNNMFKDNLKRQKETRSFDQELEIKLKTLRSDSHSKPQIKRAQLNEMVAVVDDAVQELEQIDIFSKLGQLDHRVNQTETQRIQEMSELRIKQQQSIVHRAKHQKSTTRTNQKVNDLGDHIWNLASRSEVIEFLQDNFSSKRESQSIAISDFIKQALKYYIGVQTCQQQLHKLKDLIKNQVTTTDHQTLSLNALQILTKKITIQHFIIQSYIQARLKLKLADMEKKNRKILSGVTNKIDELTIKEQQLQDRYRELVKREGALVTKQKSLNTRQKQLLQKEKEYKKNFQEKCLKMTEAYLNQVASTIKQGQKRLGQLQKNIKNKMEILQRKAENMKFLIHQQNQLKSKKVAGQSEAKMKLKKIEKEFESMEKKKKGQLEQFKNQQKEFLRTISTFQQRLSKADKKYRKLKEKTEELEQECNLLRQNCGKLQSQNTELHQLLAELKIKIPEQNVLQAVKLKQETKRSLKSKSKKSSKDICSFIYAYQYILSYTSCRITTFRTQSSPTDHIMKEMLPSIIGWLCSEEDSQDQNNRPHRLILLFNSIATKQHSAQLQRKQLPEHSNKIWSTELSELLKMPFSSVVSSSLFLFLLPILNWNHSSAAVFFQKSIEYLISALQNRKGCLNVSNFMLELQGYISQSQFLVFLILTFVSSLKQPLQNCRRQQLKIHLQLSNAVVDLLISISGSVQHADSLEEECIGEQLYFAFDVLVRCIISIYNAQTSTGRQRNQTFFEFLQIIQELSEKLSILLQRIFYQASEGEKSVQKINNNLFSLYRELQDINRSNGMRHSLILANLTSILSMVQSQI